MTARNTEIALDLGLKNVTAVLEKATAHPDGSLTWIGHVRETAKARAMTAREVRHDEANSAILVRRGNGVTGNVRVGSIIGLKRKVRLGLGFFTDVDRSRNSLQQVGDTSFRGLGGTAGLNILSRRPGTELSAAQRSGSYSLTAAVRYTHFSGEVAGIRVGDAGDAGSIEIGVTPATAHEFALHLGLNGVW